jgi:hypothetical protein
VDNANERRIPQSGFLQESRFQVWPAAIHPQTPSVPETKRPPDFRDHRDTQRGNNPPDLHLLHASSMKKSAWTTVAGHEETHTRCHCGR